MLSNLLLVLPVLVAIITAKKWKGAQAPIVHGLLILTAALVDCFIVSPGQAFWQSGLLSVGYFVFFFQYTMGVLLTKNPFFSQTGSMWRFLPWYLGLLVRGTVLAVSLILYQQLELVKFILNLIFING